MEVVVTLVCALIVLVLCYLWSSSTSKQYRLPPGPKGDFLVGHALRTWCNNEYFTAVARTYGDIFMLRVLWYKIVVVNSHEAIKEAFSNDWLTGRVQTPFTTEFTNGGHGLVLSDGELWRVHRRFSLSVLKDFGFGRSKIESTIRDELEYLRETILATNGLPFAPQQAFSKAVSNVINSIVFSERCSEDPEFESIVDLIKVIVQANAQAAFFSTFWAIAKHLPGDATGLKKVTHHRTKVYDYVGKKYQQHKETFDPSNIRDYIDAFLLQLKNGNEDLGTFTEVQLCQAIFELFLAGTETTSTTLMWALIFLAKYPEVQRKMHEEIDRTIGDSKPPESADRVKMHYVDAVIHEVQRYSTLVPGGVPHRAIEDGQIRGYDIPKGSIVISDLWNAGRVGKWLRDPENFNPDNFLDENGNLINTNYMLAFSSGKRVCLGETLAKQELFIFITGLLQRFKFVEDASEPLPGLSDCEQNSLVRAPRQFKIVAQRRTAD